MSSTTNLLSVAPSGLILSVDGQNYTTSSAIADSITGVNWNMTGASYNATRKTIVLSTGRLLYNNGGSGPSTFNTTTNTHIVLYYRLGNSSTSVENGAGMLMQMGRSPTNINNESLCYETNYWDYSTVLDASFNFKTSVRGTTGWFMRAIVKNGNVRTSYLNGQFDGMGTTANSISIVNQAFCVGSDYRDNNSYLNGEIAWVGLWNTALTSSQIINLYANWLYGGNIPADSYAVVPEAIPYPSTGTVSVQYTSQFLQSGISYALKNASNTTLTTSSYSLNSSFAATGTSYLLPIAVSSSGNIYGQGNSGSNSIYIYNSAGTSLGSITGSDSYFQFCMDPANNKMYCSGVNTFASVNLSTNTLTSYSSPWINGVALGQDGFVYATTNSGYAIQKINPATGAQTNIFTSSGGNITSDTTGTFGCCAIDGDGLLYCVTRGVGYVYKFNTSGTLLGLFATINSAYGGPFGITCDTATNNLYVSTTGSTGAIYKITPSGTVGLYTATLGSSYSVFFDRTSNILFAADRSKIYSFVQDLNKVKFAFSASSLGPGANTLQIYDASNNLFGVPIIVSVACFLEGTLIQCLSETMDAEVYIPVEKLTKQTYVKTLSSGYVQIHSIGFMEIYNPAEETDTDNRLFKYSVDRVPELFQDLYITGNHAALVDTFSQEEYDRVVAHMGAVYETEKKLRMPACLDSRAEPFVEPGPCRIWHFALQNPDIYTNYGVYANGLLVESSSIRYLTELSKMELKN